MILAYLYKWGKWGTGFKWVTRQVCCVTTQELPTASLVPNPQDHATASPVTSFSPQQTFTCQVCSFWEETFCLQLVESWITSVTHGCFVSWHNWLMFFLQKKTSFLEQCRAMLAAISSQPMLSPAQRYLAMVSSCCKLPTLGWGHVVCRMCSGQASSQRGRTSTHGEAFSNPWPTD